MRLKLTDFYYMFPNYYDHKVPMWSEFTESQEFMTLEVAIPGFEKKDFSLYVENNKLYLDVSTKAQSITYSIMHNVLENCDLENSRATYKSGVLKIEVPKVRANRVKIEVC